MSRSRESKLLKARIPFAEFLRAARRKAGLTQAQVSESIGYRSGGNFVSNWERAIALPPLDAAPLLCRILGIDRGAYYRAYRDQRIAELDAGLSHLRPPGVRP